MAPPSRQARRKAERAAAKRAPGAAASGGSGAAGGAAAARPNVNVTPLGEWTTQTENPNELFDRLGMVTLQRRANDGDGEAQVRVAAARPVPPLPGLSPRRLSRRWRYFSYL